MRRVPFALTSAMLAMGAFAAFTVAFVRADDAGDLLAPVFALVIGEEDRAIWDGDAFSDFRFGHAYLWLGLGISLTIGAVLVAVAVRRRRRPRYVYTAAILTAVAAIGAGTFARFQRDDIGATVGGVEGAYFDRTSGDPPYGEIYNGNVFDPFVWDQPYLWAGVAIGLLVTGACLFAAVRSPVDSVDAS